MRQRLVEAVPDLLRRFAKTRGSRAALVTNTGEVLSAADLDAAAWRGVSQLRDMGAGRGSVVGLLGEPGAAWMAALLACWRRGIIAAPLSHRQTDAERDRASRTLECTHRWTPNEAELLHAGKPENQQDTDWILAQPMLRVCTSGTGGAARCVDLTLEQLWFNALGSNRRLGHRRDDRWLVCLPVNHVGALAAVFRCLHNRIALELLPGFDAEFVAKRLASGDVSVVSLVPAMLESILDARGHREFAPELRAILLGGAACSEQLLQRCRFEQLPVALSWGMTETASQVATRTPGDLQALAAGIPPLPWVHVESGEDGRLIVDGPAAGRRLVTGDLGEILPSGWVRILGRSDDVINRGGENIHPSEIEAVLQSHPKIREALVLAQEEPRLGQVPVAFVRSDTVDADALRSWCRERLAGFKVPQRIVVVSDFPRIGPGKTDRAKLRKMLENEV